MEYNMNYCAVCEHIVDTEIVDSHEYCCECGNEIDPDTDSVLSELE